MLFIKTSECRQVENKRNEVIPGKPPLEEGRGGEEARPGRRHPLGDPPVSGAEPGAQAPFTPAPARAALARGRGGPSSGLWLTRKIRKSELLG